MKSIGALVVVTGIFCGVGAARADTVGSGATELIAPGEPGATALQDEALGIRPQIGYLSYQNVLGGGNTRLALGVTLDANALKAINPTGLDDRRWFIGPSSGLIFSHLGGSDSNFFGQSSVIPGDLSSNVFMIPVNLKVGYMFTDRLRGAVHGGGNLIFRTVADSMILSPSSSAGSGSTVDMFPSIGLDAEYAISKGLALTLRPDFTLTSGEDLFTGTLALAIDLRTG